jgi:hypothetical protein
MLVVRGVMRDDMSDTCNLPSDRRYLIRDTNL